MPRRALPVRCEIDPDHESQLTRDDVTASVHYINWRFTPMQIEETIKGRFDSTIDVVEPGGTYGGVSMVIPGPPAVR